MAISEERCLVDSKNDLTLQKALTQSYQLYLMRSHPSILVVLVVVFAGCLSGVPFSSNPPMSSEACNGATSPAFYALGTQVEKNIWDTKSVVVGFELGDNADILLVAYENESRLGIQPYNNTQAVAVDGLRIPLSHQLTGNHTVRVVMYGDTNENGKYDPDVDTPCQHDGTILQTENRTINFSRFTANSTTNA